MYNALRAHLYRRLPFTTNDITLFILYVCLQGDAPTTRKGCKDAVINFVESNIVVVGGVGIAFGVIEVRNLQIFQIQFNDF